MWEESSKRVNSETPFYQLHCQLLLQSLLPVSVWCMQCDGGGVGSAPHLLPVRPSSHCISEGVQGVAGLSGYRSEVGSLGSTAFHLPMGFSINCLFQVRSTHQVMYMGGEHLGLVLLGQIQTRTTSDMVVGGIPEQQTLLLSFMIDYTPRCFGQGLCLHMPVCNSVQHNKPQILLKGLGLLSIISYKY